MNQTTRNRVAFSMLYNKDTSTVIQMTTDGHTATEIYHSTGISVGRTAAIKANLTRGTYRPFVYMNKNLNKLCGSCKY